MKRHFNTFFLLACLLFVGCQSQNDQKNTNQSNVTVPELLDRNQKLWQGKEWENTQNAYVKAREAVKADPTNAEEYINLAYIFTNEARITGEHGHYYPAALEVLDEALKYAVEQDHKFRAMSTKAAVQLSQHEFEDALALAKEAVKLNSYNSHIYGVLVDAHVEMGDYENAVLMADKMVNIRPDLRSYARVSYLREIHGDVDGAIEAMKMAAEAGMPHYEQTAWTRLTLGELYENYDDAQKANAEYHKILAAREDYPFAIAAKANLLIDEGKEEEGEAMLNEAIAIIPEVGFYEDLAFLYKKNNREEELKNIVPEILAMLKDDVDHGHNMNLEYARFYSELLEDHDAALKYALAEYQKRPANIDVNRMLALIYSAKKDNATAAKYANAAERTGSKHPDLMKVKSQLAAK